MINPTDHFNFYYPFEQIFEGSKHYHCKTPTEVVAFSEPNEVLFELRPDNLINSNEAIGDIPKNSVITKFMLFSHIKFKGNWQAAQSFIHYNINKEEVPFIRVKCDYLKVVTMEDRYGTSYRHATAWKKEEIKQDHGQWMFTHIPRFDGFVMVPDNKNFKQVQGSCYNLYNKFQHQAYESEVKLTDIPYSIGIMNHVFGEQLTMGLTYMKTLYEYPQQVLPILTLISKERATGKSTFINWIQMMFGENAVQISPESITKDHNTIYAHKNIIMIDEAFTEKKSTVEKLKYITTAQYITVNPKFITEYSIPFYGKIILCTNKETDFAQIDDEEIRFWIRKLKVITTLNTSIEKDLISEVPKFLKYLEQLPTPDFSKSRMVFTPAELQTKELDSVKKESKSGVHKELEIMIEDFFDSTNRDYFEATVKDIKDRWFVNNSKVSVDYLRKVLKEQMNMTPSDSKKYSRFEYDEIKQGRVYTFKRPIESPKIIDQDPLFNKLDAPF